MGKIKQKAKEMQEMLKKKLLDQEAKLKRAWKYCSGAQSERKTVQCQNFGNGTG